MVSVPRENGEQPEWIPSLTWGTGPCRGLEVISNASSSTCLHCDLGKDHFPELCFPFQKMEQYIPTAQGCCEDKV